LKEEMKRGEEGASWKVLNKSNQEWMLEKTPTIELLGSNGIKRIMKLKFENGCPQSTRKARLDEL